jgi:hypothetical protein
MLAATHWNGTARSSNIEGRLSASRRRSGSAECRWVRCRASRPAWDSREPENMPESDSAVHSPASTATPRRLGSAAIAAPFSAPTLVPTTRAGIRRASTSARSIPTWVAPSTPPPPSTNATRGVSGWSPW